MNELFVTDQYKVLMTMYDNTITVSGEQICPLSQDLVAAVIGRSRPAVNKIFRELEKAGYIEMLGRSKWRLSEQAQAFVRNAEKL